MKLYEWLLVIGLAGCAILCLQAFANPEERRRRREHRIFSNELQELLERRRHEEKERKRIAQRKDTHQ